MGSNLGSRVKGVLPLAWPPQVFIFFIFIRCHPPQSRTFLVFYFRTLVFQKFLGKSWRAQSGQGSITPWSGDNINNFFDKLFTTFLGVYYQSRIKCPLFGGKKLKWSDDNKHPTRPHTILKWRTFLGFCIF